MKTIKFITIILVVSILPIFAFAHSKKIKGTYIYSDHEEYMQIDKDSFKIMRTQFCTSCMDLDEGDSIASNGFVEYINDSFIKLRSFKDSSAYKNTTIEESYDDRIKDSIKIRFVFPFKGKFRINVLTNLPYKSTENNWITIPRQEYAIGDLYFDIYNLSLKYNGYFNGEYLGRIVFCYFPGYKFNNKNTNSLLITIPNLTNSYYARYFIDGEYVKVENDKIIWRNREYKKISDDLIIPKVELGEQSISTGKEDIADQFFKLYEIQMKKIKK